jgi:hypothetical protein
MKAAWPAPRRGTEYRYFLRLIAHKITIRKTAMPRKIAVATTHASL